MFETFKEQIMQSLISDICIGNVHSRLAVLSIEMQYNFIKMHLSGFSQRERETIQRHILNQMEYGINVHNFPTKFTEGIINILPVLQAILPIKHFALS